jgi:Holliday junction DNA helicase RuvB
VKSLNIPLRNPHRDMLERWAREDAERSLAAPAVPQPVAFDQRTKNPLRPARLDDMIGQNKMKALMRLLIASAQVKPPMPHLLLVGPSGYGKSTIANIVGNELGVRVYQVEAPISHQTLLDLRTVMQDGDVLFVDEIHQQAIMERRGRETSTQPEVLFSVMEDRTLVSGSGVLPFPEITLIGATTDEGLLPDPFIMRFPIRPQFEPYDLLDLTLIADANAKILGTTIDPSAAMRLAMACRGIPREINNYVKMAVTIYPSNPHGIDDAIAEEVLDYAGVTDDGLTRDMQRTLLFLYEKCKRTTKDGSVTYKASIGRIATGIGKGRDAKAIAMRVEPYLIEKGLLSAGHGGRELTDAGIARAKSL